MKIANFLTLLAASCAMAGAQDQSPVGSVAIRTLAAKVKYCLGATDWFQPKQPVASDITLRIYLSLRYKNDLPGPIIVPLGYRSVARMVVVGEHGLETINSRDNTADALAFPALVPPAPPYFVVIPGGASEARYFGEIIDVPVRRSGERLLGKTIQVSITRDHGLSPSALTTELENRWKAYGVLWTGHQDFTAVTVSIPKSPRTVDCRKDDKF